MGFQELNTAMTKRSLRTVRAELDFLAESSAITPAQHAAILAQLPADADSTRASGITNGVSNLSMNNTTSPAPTTTTNGYPNEKADFYTPTPVQSQPPPPSYATSTPAPGVGLPPIAPVALTHATALYAYTASDAGDLNLAPNDRIAVTEYMNADWWKGRNERTGLEGIFPRSYVKVEEKSVASTGIMPLDVANAPTGGQPGQPPSKLQEGGKKFGKKLGNAAIFGAGATIGGNIVNSIF